MSGDADGYKRGAKGIDGRKDEGFAKPDFDREKQQGPLCGGGSDGGFAPGNKGSKGVKS